MSGLIILIILVVGLPYLWRILRPYILRWAQLRTQKIILKAMGVPPHDRKHRDSASRGDSRERRQYSYGYRRPHASGPIIPKEYAEDVEYTEIRTYSEEHTIGAEEGNVKFRRESQVSDAEIIEIEK